MLHSNHESDSNSCSKTFILSEYNCTENASSESVCDVCFNVGKLQPKSSADYSISCELCKEWYHISWAGVTEEKFNDVNYFWTCSFCPPIDFTINS